MDTSLSVLIALPVYGQITINNNGNVAIKTENTVSVRALNVECGFNCGNPGSSYGIYSTAEGSYGTYGIRGHAQNGYAGYGVYGSASDNTISYAGYFSGDVYSTGNYLTSDERFKTNIRSLREESVLAGLSQLTAVRYEYLGANELRQQGLPESHAKEGEHLGILAGEVENIFPELIRDVVHFLNEDENGNPPENVVTKAVNYNGLIPVLIAAIQEQQEKIDEIEARIAALESMMQE